MTNEQSDLLKRPIWHYIKKHKRLVALGLTWLFITNALETLVPWLVGQTLDKITADAPLREVFAIIAYIFVVIVFLSLFRFLWRVFWSTFHHTSAEDLRNRSFAGMSLLGPSFFRTRKIGQMISLISNDVNSFRMGIGPGLLVIFDGVFLIALIVPVMGSISWTWTWQTLLLMPFVPFMVKWILSRMHVQYHERQERFADLSGSAQEIVSGIRTIKGFAQETHQTAQFNVHSAAFRHSCDRVAAWDALFGPSLELPVALGSVLLLLLGTPAVMAGEVSLGQFFAFYQYIQRMVWPMSAIGIGLGQVQEARASFSRIEEVLRFQPDVPDTGDVDVAELITLEVRDLSFSYPGATLKALDGVSFRLARGECMGIVGMTGSGKSTLVELLTRQYPVPPGTILINGISVERIRLESLRRLIGVVPQDAFLFSRRVSENMALGLDDWDMDDVESAARTVRLDQEIATWPDGFEALVGERGVNLSGGQKQRMTLARAMVREAPLVILDDSLSAVDAKTEEVILKQLRDDLARTTSIVVSHRLASVRHADMILVLRAGRVESLGRHEELIRVSETYQILHEMQMQGRSG
ncbi:MAG: ABC transporter ATP-binding protein [Bdellovibrionales bacterium]|nr:ABC transporter ATP-binding protein [Bdellovibrionales bacterium]